MKATYKDVQNYFFTPRDKGGKGWKIGGYHIIIEKNGSIRRVYYDDVVTNGVLAFAGVWNKNSLHISYTGGRNPEEVTKQQLHSIRRCMAHFIKEYPDIKVLGHNQIAEKYCPSFNVELLSDLFGIPRKNVYTRHYFPAFSGAGLPPTQSIIDKLNSREEYAEDVELAFNMISY